MSLHLERIDWMPSPPLVPFQSPIDRDHLDRMTLGDEDLRRDVLTLFLDQSEQLARQLGTASAHLGEVAHKLKGSANAVGAFAVAHAAEAVEAALRHQNGLRPAVEALQEEIDEARAAIRLILE